jgi:hypothetical protein
MRVRRLATLALAHALVVSSFGVSPLHMHEYVGHDHPDHHHGPAIHGHTHAATGAHHGGLTEEHHRPALQADRCDAGKHAVTVAMGGAFVVQLHLDTAELPGPTIAIVPAPAQSTAPVTDVRVHGPPHEIRLPSRAPPLTVHA